ncbi:methyltransferase domain-containing protein [Granulosicoccus sp. 3-233]|uniref:methyltransferase domain-containing protein n=1 Tax=Granulosicoccus sp. 3-233 TaxID=3417969 RepID=UPI003D33CFBD
MSLLIQPGPMSLVRRHFQKAAGGFDAHAAVFETVGERLRERLDLLAIEPTRVLDLGCRSGYQLDALQRRFPQAQIVGADPAPGPASTAGKPDSWSRWLRRPWRSVRTRLQAEPGSPETVACDPHALPFADGSFDLVVCNLLLPWCHSPHRVFEEVARILTGGGAFFFTSAGPDTLLEYRAAWATIDSHPHGFGLVDMHDLGDTLMASGFAAPVLDRDNLRVDYPSMGALQSELRELGALNIANGRRQGLMSPSVRQALDTAAADAERFAVTLELVQGHGWKGELDLPGRRAGDEYRVSIDSLRGSRGRRSEGVPGESRD